MSFFEAPTFSKLSRLCYVILFVTSSLFLISPVQAACPFCDAQTPSYSQRLELSPISFVGEVTAKDEKGMSKVKIHHLVKNELQYQRNKMVSVLTGTDISVGGFAVFIARRKPALEGKDKADRLVWNYYSATETGLFYFVRAPKTNQSNVERLKYFAKFLEHEEDSIAKDAYVEFAHAPFSDVSEVYQQVPLPQLMDWVEDVDVVGERKGLFGLMIGLWGTTSAEKKNVSKYLHQYLQNATVDYQSGVNGLMGGYLLCAGESAIKFLEEKFLINPKSPEGFTRHAMNAVRFYWSYGKEIPAERIQLAMTALLAKDRFAAEIIPDLIRWKSWQGLNRIISIYKNSKDDIRLKHACIAFLFYCPLPQAKSALEDFRKANPELVNQAEKRLLLLPGSR